MAPITVQTENNLRYFGKGTSEDLATKTVFLLLDSKTFRLGQYVFDTARHRFAKVSVSLVKRNTRMSRAFLEAEPIVFLEEVRPLDRRIMLKIRRDGSIQKFWKMRSGGVVSIEPSPVLDWTQLESREVLKRLEVPTIKTSDLIPTFLQFDTDGQCHVICAFNKVTSRFGWFKYRSEENIFEQIHPERWHTVKTISQNTAIMMVAMKNTPHPVALVRNSEGVLQVMDFVHGTGFVAREASEVRMLVGELDFDPKNVDECARTGEDAENKNNEAFDEEKDESEDEDEDEEKEESEESEEEEDCEDEDEESIREEQQETERKARRFDNEEHFNVVFNLRNEESDDDEEDEERDEEEDESEEGEEEESDDDEGRWGREHEYRWGAESDDVESDQEEEVPEEEKESLVSLLSNLLEDLELNATPIAEFDGDYEPTVAEFCEEIRRLEEEEEEDDDNESCTTALELSDNESEGSEGLEDSGDESYVFEDEGDENGEEQAPIANATANSCTIC